MEKTLAVFIPIALFICITLCVYFVSKFRYGAITKLGGPIPKSRSTKIDWKKIGIVVVGFAVGLLVVWAGFETGLLLKSWNGFPIVGIVSLFVGIALVVADKFGDKDKTING